MKGCVYLLFAGHLVLAQPSLKIDRGVVFQLTGDSFSVDSLIMADSSVLLLDDGHANNLIHANYVSIGNHCVLRGDGKNGENGPPGADGSSSAYANGKDGRGGFSAVNLFLNLTQLETKDLFRIVLIGGKGGNGGMGGAVTSSLSGISSPNASRLNAPAQGSPGNGGDGGRGGNVTLSFPESLDAVVKERIKIINVGGEGGDPGGANNGTSQDSWSLNKAAPQAGKHGATGSVKIFHLRKE